MLFWFIGAVNVDLQSLWLTKIVMICIKHAIARLRLENDKISLMQDIEIYSALTELRKIRILGNRNDDFDDKFSNLKSFTMTF